MPNKRFELKWKETEAVNATVKHLLKLNPHEVLAALRTHSLRRIGSLPVTVHRLGKSEIAAFHSPWSESPHSGMFESLAEIAHLGGGAIATPLAFVRFNRPSQQVLVVHLPSGSKPLNEILGKDGHLKEKQDACRRVMRRIALLDATNHHHHALRPFHFAVSPAGRVTLLHYSGIQRNDYDDHHRSSDISLDLASALHSSMHSAHGHRATVDQIQEGLQHEYASAYTRYKKKLIDVAQYRKAIRA